MANWRCNDCGLDILEDDASTEAEPCPRCGKDMTRVDGVVLKNFGGGGFTTMEDKRG
ncbi:MAG TPA: hypothetical protein VHL54_03080 [Actinomycetota bacterium]|nr:hypothetical protein [Actinomycetota bacterium]